MADYGQGYFYTPSDQTQIDAFERQRRLALALQQQGAQDPGDTPYAGLASAGKSLAGALLGTGIDQKERDLTTSAQNKYTSDMAAFLKGGNGAPAGGQMSPQSPSVPSPQISNAGGPDMPVDEAGMAQGAGPTPQPIPNAQGPSPMPQAIPNAQGAAPAPTPMGLGGPPQPAQPQSPMERLLATGNPALIQQFAPQLFTHQQDINDRKVVPISDIEAVPLGLRPGGVYGREAATGNLTTIQASDMKSAGAMQQGLNEKIDEARLVPVTAAEQLAHRDRQAATAVTANQPHFVPYGTSSYIQNGKMMNIGAGGPGGPGGTSPAVPGGDPNSKSPNGQLGISSNAYNLLIGNNAAVPRGRPMDMASHELDQMIQRRGLDPSIVKPRVQAYGDAVKMNTLKANTMDTLTNELQGTIQNIIPVADKLGGGSVRWTKEGAQLIGSIANDPNAQQYVYYLNQLRSELAGFNAVSGGKIGLHGQVETNESHIAEAEKVIRNGLDSGGAKGLAQAVEASRQKNVGVVEHQSNEAQRGIWNALGLGPQYDAQHPHNPPPPAGSGGGATHPPPPPGFVVH